MDNAKKQPEMDQRPEEGGPDEEEAINPQDGGQREQEGGDESPTEENNKDGGRGSAKKKSTNDNVRKKRMKEAQARREAEEKERAARANKLRTPWAKLYHRYKARKKAQEEARLRELFDLMEKARQEVENDRMEWEEKLTWDAYELRYRNFKRMSNDNEARLLQREEEERRLKEAEDRRLEIGLAFQGSAIVGFQRYRDSAALINTFTGHEAQVLSVKVSRDYRFLLSASEDNTARLWDLASGDWLNTYQGHTKPVRDVDFPPDFQTSNLLLSCSSDKTLRLWERSRPNLPRLILRGHTDVVYCCSFSPDGMRILSSSEDGTIRLWDRTEGYTIYIYRGHRTGVPCCAFSPTGRFIVSGSSYDEMAIKLWYGHLPIIYTPKPVGMTIKWSMAGLIRKVELCDQPKEDFLVDTAGQDDDDDDDDDEDKAKLKGQDDPSRKKTNRKRNSTHSLTSSTEESTKQSGLSGGKSMKKDQPSRGDPDGGSWKEEEEEEVENDDPRVPEAPSGYQLEVNMVDRLGRVQPTKTYHPGQILRVTIRGNRTFKSFFLAAYRDVFQYSIYEAESGDRVGRFRKHDVLTVGVKMTCQGKACQNLRSKDMYETTVEWIAPSIDGRGVGPVSFKASIQAPDGTGTGTIPGTTSGSNKWFILKYAIAETTATSEPNTEDRGTMGTNSNNKKKYDFNLVDRHNMVLNLLEKGAGSGGGPGAFDDLRYVMASKVQLAWKPCGKTKEKGTPQEEQELTACKGQDAVLLQLLALAKRLRLYKRVQTIMNKGQSRVILIVESQDLDPPESSSSGGHGLTLSSRLFNPENNIALGLKPAEDDNGKEDEERRNKEMAALAEKEVQFVEGLKADDWSIANEVRHVRLVPSPKDTKKFGARQSSVEVYGPQEYPHLTMPFPSIYPIYAKPYHLQANDLSRIVAATATTTAMTSIHSFKYHGKSSATSSTPSHLREQILEALAIQEKAKREEAKHRRRNWGQLPGFLNGLSNGSTGPSSVGSIVPAPANSRTDLQIFPLAIDNIESSRNNGVGANSSVDPFAPGPGSRVRTTSFDAMPGFESCTGSGKRDDHNRGGDQLKQVALRNNGLLRTFEQALQTGHWDSITQVVFSLDESRVASTGHDGAIRVWDPETGRLVRVLQGHKRAGGEGGGSGEDGTVFGVCFSDDGYHLLSCGADRQIILWSLVTGDVVQRLHGHDNMVYRSFFFKNANQMISCSHDTTIKYWSLTPDVPAKVKGLVIGTKAATTVELSWQAPPAYNNDIIAYRVSYRINSDSKNSSNITATVNNKDESEFTVEYGVSGITLHHVVQDLSPGTAYQFRVRAVNNVGDGEWSHTTPEVITDVGIPDKIHPRVAVVGRDATSVTLLWRSPCDMNAVAATHAFKVQCEGRQVSFNDDDAGPANMITVPWDQAMEAAYEFTHKYKHTQRSLYEILFPASVVAREKEEKRIKAERERRHLERRSKEGKGHKAEVEGGKAELKAPENKKPMVTDSSGMEHDVTRIYVKVSSKRKGRHSFYRYKKPTPVPALEAGAAHESQGSLAVVGVGEPPAAAAAGAKLEPTTSSTRDAGAGPTASRKWCFPFKLPRRPEKQPPPIAAKPLSPPTQLTDDDCHTPNIPPAVQSDQPPPGPAASVTASLIDDPCSDRTKSPVKSEKDLKDEESAAPAVVRRVEVQGEDDGRRYVYMVGTFPKLDPGEVYRFRVAGINSAGRGVYSEPSYSVETLCAPPDKPSPPVMVETALRSMTIEWVPPRENGTAITGYGLWMTHLKVELRLKRYQTSFMVQGLEPGVGYTFKVRALNALGAGPWSDLTRTLATCTAAPDPPPTPRIGAKVTPVGTELVLEMPLSNNGEDVTWFILQRRQLNNFSRTHWGSDIRVDVDKRFWQEHSREMGVNGRKSNLAARLASSAGDANYAMTTMGDQATPGQGNRANEKERCQLPVIREDQGGRGGSVQVKTGQASKEDSSQRQCTVLLDQRAHQVYHTSQIFVTGLKAATVYDFRVSAGNAQGLSGWSKPSKKVKTLSACPPLAPAMPQILQTTPNSVLLSWSEPDCLGAPIKGYTIEAFKHTAIKIGLRLTLDEDVTAKNGEGGGGGGALPAGITLALKVQHDGGSRERRVRGLEPKGKYSFRVAGINAKGQGAFSEFSATVVLPPIPGDPTAASQPPQPPAAAAPGFNRGSVTMGPRGSIARPVRRSLRPNA